MPRVKSDIEQAVNHAGLLLSPDPQIGDWQTTRAVSPEIVAFTNEVASISRLSINFYRGGEEDENGYTWRQDSYVLSLRDEEQEFQPRSEGTWTFRDRKTAINKCGELMEQISTERE